MQPDRRHFLKTALGCSLAASPLITSMAWARAPGDNRLVVIILRGAMDGLDAVRPVGDSAFAALRPTLNEGAPALELDGFFALHPALGGLHSLWGKGELAVAHAVSTPYRDKRSHFDGQDLLEAGISPGQALRDGWLNRALTLLPGAGMHTALAVGREDLLILTGAAPVTGWAPDTALTLSPQSRLLLERLYAGDALFSESLATALDLAEGVPVQDYDEARDAMLSSLKAASRGSGAGKLARFTAEQLLGEARIAAFSLTGWDTHRAQKGGLRRALQGLEEAILTLREDLGPVWGKTMVLAMTEFGRTARENGSGGTDHGTGGAMFMAGGALRGGQVYGRWPGLGEADLYARRDLMPTSDLRGYAAGALEGLFGLEQTALERLVFPGLDRDAIRRVAR